MRGHDTHRGSAIHDMCSWFHHRVTQWWPRFLVGGTLFVFLADKTVMISFFANCRICSCWVTTSGFAMYVFVRSLLNKIYIKMYASIDVGQRLPHFKQKISLLLMPLPEPLQNNKIRWFIILSSSTKGCINLHTLKRVLVLANPPTLVSRYIHGH
jgi:hypothetical protein